MLIYILTNKPHTQALDCNIGSIKGSATFSEHRSALSVKTGTHPKSPVPCFMYVTPQSYNTEAKLVSILCTRL